MARGLNRLELIGHIGADPEVKYTPSGICIATIAVAVSESWIDQNTKQKHEHTEWTNVTFFRKTGELIAEHVKKGALVYVSARKKTDKWQDKTSGENRYREKYNGQSFEILKWPDDNQNGGQSTNQTSQASQQQQAPVAAGGPAEFSDDIPF